VKTGVKHGNKDDVEEMNDLPVAEKGKESGLKGNLKKTVFKVSNATVGLLRLGNETSKFVFLSEA